MDEAGYVELAVRIVEAHKVLTIDPDPPSGKKTMTLMIAARLNGLHEAFCLVSGLEPRDTTREQVVLMAGKVAQRVPAV